MMKARDIGKSGILSAIISNKLLVVVLFLKSFLITPSLSADMPRTFADLVAKVSPAVVNISTTQSIEDKNPSNSFDFTFPPGSLFEDYFNEFGLPDGDANKGTQQRIGLGSGFIIDPNGYVVTNYHVIKDAQAVQVTLNNGKQYEASLVGVDQRTDIAVLKIETKQSLVFVQLGDSDKARVGDWIVAVGNPFGLGGSVTVGVLSARGRDIQSGPFDDFLQLDAAINRGNSGGPSFNLQGEVIGINTAIYSPNGGSVGIGFAIPSNVAKPIITALKEKGAVERGWLGIQIQPVTPEISEAVGLSRAQGALIISVQPNSPAARAGLLASDVITAVNQQAITEMRDLPKLIASIAPGKKVSLSVWRDQKTISIPIELGRLEDPQTNVILSPAVVKNPPISNDSQMLEGASLSSLNVEFRQRFNIADQTKGVGITDVKASSMSASQGLKKGDVIVQVGQKRITSLAELEMAIQNAKSAKKSAILFLINRQGSETFLAFKF
ncbi:MAG: DegQ family serine endoprotease [Rhodospirillaceae bacterium]|nr:DegQ family serine endoprotease [Rhodospirillaceae bacterium]